MSLALLVTLIGLSTSTVAGCAPGADDADDSTSNFTLDDGSKFIVSAAPQRIVLKTSVGDCTGCSLLEALTRDSKNKIGSLDDLKGKAVLVHPIEGIADDGAFTRVTDVSQEGDLLTLEGDPVLLEELISLDEDDVVRVYMDKKIPRAGAGGADGPSLKTARFAPALSPSLDFGTLQPQGFGGLLAGDAPTVILWQGIVPKVSFLGSVKPFISDMSFRPEVKLDWKAGVGLEAGVQLDVASEAGIDVTGILGGSGQLFKMKTETPDLTMLIPSGLALPFKFTLSASFGCQMVGGGKVDFSYRNPVKVHAGGSAVIHPAWDKPVAEWVRPGSWPFSVTGSSDGKITKFEVAPSSGLICRVELNANFSPKWLPAGVAGLFISVAPQMILLAEAEPKPRWSVSLGAGAWANKTSAELTLLTWKP